MPPSTYAALRDQVDGILAEGQSHARQASAWERVETYWAVGDALLSHIASQPRADYGQQVIPTLSRDSGLSQSVLWDVLRFRRLVPLLPARRRLSWSHYRRLVHVDTQDRFRFYERLASDGRLSVQQLADAIRTDAYTAAVTRPLALSDDALPDGEPGLLPRFGPLFIYKVVVSPDPRTDHLCLDLGFHICARVPLTGLTDPRPGQLVTARSEPDGTYRFEPVPASTLRYTYLAWVGRIIDGDTFVGAADPGLGLAACNLRFRLRGIDTLELNTLAGRNARRFVTDALAGVAFVVVRTHRTDSFGRYLADLRYLPGVTDPDVVRARGIYLNQQLLDERLARPFRG